MQKLVCLLFACAVNFNYCMTHNEENTVYKDACAILQGTSDNGFLDPKKIKAVSIAMEKIRHLLQKSRHPIKLYQPNVLKICASPETVANITLFLNKFEPTYIRPTETIITAKLPHQIDVLYIKKLLETMNAQVDVEYYDLKYTKIEFKELTPQDWKFNMLQDYCTCCPPEERLQEYIHYDPVAQKITKPNEFDQKFFYFSKPDRRYYGNEVI